MKRSILALLVLSTLLLLLVGRGRGPTSYACPMPTATPTPSPNSVTVNFGSVIGSGNPQVFGVTNFGNETDTDALTTGAASVEQALGIKLAKFYFPATTFPVTNLSTWETDLAAGCPTGSSCDPNTWNTSVDVAYIAHAQAVGMKVLLDVEPPPAWDQTGGAHATPDSIPVWQKMISGILGKVGCSNVQYADIWSEPNLQSLGNGITTAQYQTIYSDMASTIKTACSNISVGGPATTNCCENGEDFVSAMRGGTGEIDHYSFHAYGQTGQTNLGLGILADYPSIPSGVPVLNTEWNNTSSPAAEYEDGTDSAAWQGAILSQFLSNGFAGTTYFEGTGYLDCDTIGPGPDGGIVYTNGATEGQVGWMAGVCLKRAYVWYLMSHNLGLGAGTSSLVSTTWSSGVQQALGAFNSASQHAVTFVNYSASAATFTINMSGLSGSSASYQVWLSDEGSNQAQSPTQTGTMTISGGNASVNVSMTAYSTGGLLF